MSTLPRPCTHPSAIAPDHGPWRHGSVPGADDVDVRRRAQIRPGSEPRSVIASVSSSVARRLLARVAGMRAQRGEVVLDQLRLEPELLRPRARARRARRAPGR